MKLIVALALAGSMVASGAYADPVFSDDFQTGSTSGFTGGTIQTSPNGTAKFLGQFAQGGSTTLSLNGLAAHTSVTLSFDLDVLLSMDGDGQFGGARDQFLLTYAGASESVLLDNDYANYPGNKQDTGGQGTPTVAGGYNPGTGASSTNTFGYAFDGDPTIDDSVYHYSFTFNDAAAALAFTFQGNTSEGTDNEFYGIDNVVVSTNAAPTTGVPEPATWAMMFAGFGLVGAGMRRRSSRMVQAI